MRLRFPLATLAAVLLIGCQKSSRIDPAAQTAAGPQLSAGLVGEYFASDQFTRPVLRRIDPAIYFDWANGSPAQGVPAGAFSVRWTGWIKVPVAGRYVLSPIVDDDVRIWIDDRLIVDTWRDGNQAVYRAADLSGELQRFRMDFSNHAGLGIIKFEWSQGDMKPVPVPASVFFHNVDSAAQPAATAAATRPASGSAHSIDLLRLIDPDRDAVSGQWSLRNGQLVSDDQPNTRLRIPYQPPQEYDFEIQFSRIRGSDSIVQFVSSGKAKFLWNMGGWYRGFCGFDQVAGLRYERNRTFYRLPQDFRPGERHACIVQVRRNYVAASIDGKVVSRHETDFSDLSLPDDWMMPDEALGVGSQLGGTVFHVIRLIEITGNGRASPLGR